jgi:hypothetical protein
MVEGMAFMQVPQWAKNEGTFWRRHYELATLTEQACEQALEQQLQSWLMELEGTDGPVCQHSRCELASLHGCHLS